MLKNTLTSYGSVAKFFHWTIFLLVFCMLIYGFFLDDIPKEYQPITYNIHKMTGLTILSLMILRLLWSLFNIKPELPLATPYWQIVVERIVHFLLYFFLITMPLVGWIGSVAGNKPPHLGSFNFTLPITAPNKQLGEVAFFLHNQIALILIALISLHALAAFYHYFFKKDDILQRMLP